MNTLAGLSRHFGVLAGGMLAGSIAASLGHLAGLAITTDERSVSQLVWDRVVVQGGLLQTAIGGALAGTAVGIVLALWLEHRASTFRDVDDILQTLDLPVLTVVPANITTAERSARKRRIAWLVAGSAAMIGVPLAYLIWWFGIDRS